MAAAISLEAPSKVRAEISRTPVEAAVAAVEFDKGQAQKPVADPSDATFPTKAASGEITSKRVQRVDLSRSQPDPLLPNRDPGANGCAAPYRAAGSFRGTLPAPIPIAVPLTMRDLRKAVAAVPPLQ
jgi:hypothetical protein